MKRRIPAVAGGLLVALALSAGCSSSNPPPMLSVGAVTAPAMVAGIAPPSGRYFVEVPVTLTNPNETPISGWWYYYGATTEKGLVLAASADASTAVAMSCSSDTELFPLTATPASFTCNLVFEVPCADAPTAVIYEGDGKVTALISSAPAPGC